MVLEYKKSESTVRPEPVDTTSSKTTVYLRKDVVERQRVDEMSGESYAYYEYLEAKLTRDEYEQYLAENSVSEIAQVRADLDYIFLYTGVPLE